MRNEISIEEKFDKAINYINSAGEHLALAWQLVEKAGGFDSAEELFHHFRRHVIFTGNFRSICLYLYGSKEYTLHEPDEKRCPKYNELTKFSSCEDIKRKFSEVFKVQKSFILIEEIKYKDHFYGILVAITKEPPDLITYNSLGILNLFLQFIRLKIIEKREGEFRAFQKAVSEKAILISENLVLQDLWTSKMSHLLEMLTSSLFSQNDNVKNEDIVKLLDKLKDDVEPLRKLNRSTRSIVRSFSYMEEMEAITDKTSLKNLFREVEISIPPEFIPELDEKEELFVDQEQVNEGIKQIFFILNNLLDNPKRTLQIEKHCLSGDKLTIKIGSKRLKTSWLKFLKKEERFWNNNGKGPTISGPILLSFKLARKLIGNSHGELRISNSKEATFRGFEIELPCYPKSGDANE